MRLLRTNVAFSALTLAAGLCLAACSKEGKTSLLVNVSLDNAVTATPDTVTFVVSRGSTNFTSQHADWTTASGGTLEVALLLPAEADGDVTLEVRALLGGENGKTIAETSRSTKITAGKVSGPVSVTLTPAAPDYGDAGADALPGDAASPDILGSPDTRAPDAGVAADARGDEPGLDTAAPDAPTLSDVLPASDVAQSPDVLQSPDAPSADLAQSTDSPQSTDVVEARLDAGIDRLAVPAWQPVENVVNDPFGYPNASVVAVDPVNEHVYVMWIDWMVPAVRVRRWNRTTASWEQTHTLEDNSGGNPVNPQIGVDGAGQVTATWTHHEPQDTTLLGVRASQSPDGVSWSKPAPITPNRQVEEASLAVARNGTARLAFTVWDSDNQYTPTLYSAYYDGKTWTAGPDALAVQPDASSPPYPSPSVAISDQGSGIILFTQRDDKLNDSVAVATFAGATLDPYVLLDSDTTSNLENRAVAVNRDGQGAVAWGDSNGVELRSYSPSTKKWAEARNIGNVGFRQPAMVMASDGTITLAWSQESNSGYFNAWTMEGTAAGTWTTPTALETDNLSIQVSFFDADYGPLPSPTLAMDAAGNVLLVWSKKTQATVPRQFAVCARRKLAGKPAGVWQATTELARKSMQPWGLSVGVSDSGLGAAGYYWDDVDGTKDPDAHQVFVSLFR